MPSVFNEKPRVSWVRHEGRLLRIESWPERTPALRLRDFVRTHWAAAVVVLSLMLLTIAGSGLFQLVARRLWR